jgi:hypothetical protein
MMMMMVPRMVPCGLESSRWERRMQQWQWLPWQRWHRSHDPTHESLAICMLVLSIILAVERESSSEIFVPNPARTRHCAWTRSFVSCQPVPSLLQILNVLHPQRGLRLSVGQTPPKLSQAASGLRHV